MRRAVSATICTVLSVPCMLGVILCASMLEQPGVGNYLLTGGGMLALIALSMILLRCEKVRISSVLIMLLPITVAMLIRVLCMDYASLDYQDFLSKWYVYFRENGGFKAMAGSIGDYNVPYLYFMAAISYLDLSDLYLIKMFSILFDVLLAWGGFRLARVLRGERQGDPVPLIAFAVLLFLPTVVLNGAYWGQCDGLYGALVVHALAQVLAGKNKSSVVLLAIAFSFKLQTVFLIPLWGVLWLAKKVKFRELLLFPATYVVTIVPALLMGKPLGDILGVYFNQMDEYSYRLTLNAPSVFQFIPYGMEVNDKLLAKLGIIAAFVLVLALLILGICLRKRMNVHIAMAMAAVLAIGVPFLLPHMHERYFFLADVICVCWVCVGLRNLPAAVLAAGSSLASYIVYLRLLYNGFLRIGPYYFVMGWEALAMLAALLISIVMLVLEICKRGESNEIRVVECERPESLPEEGIS